MKISYVFVFALSLFIVSCSNEPAGTEAVKGDRESLGKSEKAEYLKNLRNLEAQLYTASKFDETVALSMVNQYADFAKNFPEDSLAPECLFKAGEISSSLRQGSQAIHFFRSVCEKYPTYQKVHYALFLQAFVYETQMNDQEKARSIYNEVIEKYPNEQVAVDAKASIQNLGKSDEELIREFEAKNKSK